MRNRMHDSREASKTKTEKSAFCDGSDERGREIKEDHISDGE